MTDAFESLPRWQQQQYKTFLGWCNYNLSDTGIVLKDIETAFETGEALAKLLEVLDEGAHLGRLRKNPRYRIQKISNLVVSFNYMKEKCILNVETDNISSVDVVDKDIKLILGLIWHLITYQIKRKGMTTASLGDTAKEQLLERVRTASEGPGPSNFTADFADGSVLCQLLHSAGALDYEKVPSTDKERLHMAFTILEEKYGVPRLLDIEDMANPDEKSIMAYVTMVLDGLDNGPVKSSTKAAVRSGIAMIETSVARTEIEEPVALSIMDELADLEALEEPTPLSATPQLPIETPRSLSILEELADLDSLVEAGQDGEEGTLEKGSIAALDAELGALISLTEDDPAPEKEELPVDKLNEEGSSSISVLLDDLDTLMMEDSVAEQEDTTHNVANEYTVKITNILDLLDAIVNRTKGLAGDITIEECKAQLRDLADIETDRDSTKKALDDLAAQVKDKLAKEKASGQDITKAKEQIEKAEQLAKHKLLDLDDLREEKRKELAARIRAKREAEKQAKERAEKEKHEAARILEQKEQELAALERHTTNITDASTQKDSLTNDVSSLLSDITHLALEGKKRVPKVVEERMPMNIKEIIQYVQEITASESEAPANLSRVMALLVKLAKGEIKEDDDPKWSEDVINCCKRAVKDAIAFKNNCAPYERAKLEQSVIKVEQVLRNRYRYKPDTHLSITLDQKSATPESTLVVKTRSRRSVHTPRAKLIFVGSLEIPATVHQVDTTGLAALLDRIRQQVTTVLKEESEKARSDSFIDEANEGLRRMDQAAKDILKAAEEENESTFEDGKVRLVAAIEQLDTLLQRHHSSQRNTSAEDALVQLRALVPQLDVPVESNGKSAQTSVELVLAQHNHLVHTFNLMNKGLDGYNFLQFSAAVASLTKAALQAAANIEEQDRERLKGTASIIVKSAVNLLTCVSYASQSKIFTAQQLVHRALSSAENALTGIYDVYLAAEQPKPTGPPCAKCMAPIVKAFIEFNGEKYHPECFSCRVCGTLLEGKKYGKLDNQPYCEGCYRSAFTK